MRPLGRKDSTHGLMPVVPEKKSSALNFGLSPRGGLEFFIDNQGKVILAIGCESSWQGLWEGEDRESFSYPGSLGILKKKGECKNEERTLGGNFFSLHAGYPVFGIG